MDELGLPDLYEAAARATINERCALAYLHDIRGSMQALFSALELLGRSATSAYGNPERLERACDLARRAINNHEKSTIDALQVLTLQHTEATAVDAGELLCEVVRFLRNDAANKEVVMQVAPAEGVRISAERAKLRTLLVGLLTAAIDETPHGAALPLSIDRLDGNAVLSVGSDAGYRVAQETLNVWDGRGGRLHPRELTLLFARRFLAANGGRLEIDPGAPPLGELRVYYPIAPNG
ncbi:MAG: Histidine kinase [Gammaproteobacteria bacterium]|nr:Histidine kinase [Gammaproteobacteria bacterium]